MLHIITAKTGVLHLGHMFIRSMFVIQFRAVIDSEQWFLVHYASYMLIPLLFCKNNSWCVSFCCLVPKFTSIQSEVPSEYSVISQVASLFYHQPINQSISHISVLFNAEAQTSSLISAHLVACLSVCLSVCLFGSSWMAEDAVLSLCFCLFSLCVNIVITGE